MAAAVPLTAFMKQRDRLVGKNVDIVLCGANIGIATLKEIL
jgi:threonine dehydratase